MKLTGGQVVVVSADPERRASWSRSRPTEDLTVTQCAGDAATCPLLADLPCPLLDESAVVIYDRATLDPRIARALGSRRPGHALLFVAHDDGSGHPTGLGPIPVRRHLSS